MQKNSVKILRTNPTLRGAIERKREQIADMKRTAINVGKTESFMELAAIILARSYQGNGRKKEARNLLTTYLQHNPATNGIITALNANDLA